MASYGGLAGLIGAGAGAGAAAGNRSVYDNPRLQQDLIALTNHLGDAYSQLEEHGAQDQFITFDRPLHRLIPRPLSSSIYVRPLYWGLLDKLKAAAENDASVVTGHPGVGKSAFAPLLIAYLAHERRPVLYRHLAASHETLVMMDFRSTPFQCRMASYSAELQIRWKLEHPRGWVIWDGYAPKGQHGRMSRTVVLSPPEEETWNEFMKGSWSAPALWLDTWTLPELQACIRLKSTRPDFKAEAAEVAEHFRVWGGVPRFVLEGASGACVTLEDVIGQFMPWHMEDLLSVRPLGTSIDINIGQRLLHARADSNFKFLHDQLASPEILRCVTAKLSRYAKTKLLDLILRGGSDNHTAVLRGFLFEQQLQGHNALQAGLNLNSNVQMCQLLPPGGEGSGGSSGMSSGSAPAAKRLRRGEEEGEGEEEEGEWEEEDEGEEGGEQGVPGAASHHFPGVSLASRLHQRRRADAASSSVTGSMQCMQLSSMGDVPHAESGAPLNLPRVRHVWDSPGLDLSQLDEVYVQPNTTSNAAWDAFYKHSGCGQVLLLQYTLGLRQGVRQGPVRRFLQRLSEEDRGRVKMVFVVPAGGNMEWFKGFQYQEWLGKSGKVLRRVDKDVQAMQQWVVALPLQ